VTPHPAVAFLQHVWGPRMPPGLFAQLWAKKGAKSRSAYPEHWAGVEAFAITHQHGDVYVGVSALRKPLAASVRGKAKDSAAIPGFWLDADVGEGYAPSMEAASMATRLIVPPTLTVCSGRGVHAWWLFDEPWVFADEDERQEAAQLADGWVQAHRQLCPFKLDSVGELARVLRLPGTLNHKTDPPTPVSLLGEPGERFPRETLAEHARGRSSRLQATLGDGEPGSLAELPGADDVPWPQIRAMREADDVFARTWQRKRKGAAVEWSDSEYDLSLLTMMLRAGMEEAQAVAAAQHARREFGNPEKADKAERLDYWQRTLRAAKRGEAPEQRDADAKKEEAKLLGELRELRETPRPTAPAAITTDRETRLSKINQLVGGGIGSSPRVMEWHQYGTDPESARHVWVLSDGTEAPLGPMKAVMHQATVKAALLTVSSILMPRQWKQATWELGIHAFAPLRVWHADPEQERDQRALEWVSQVVGERTLESDPEHLNEAIAMRRPFLRDGRVHITQGYLGQQLRVQRIAPDTKDTDLAPMLRAAGFERAPVNFDRNGTGTRSTRSYWSIPAELLP
jgi:hypothetical protein